MRGTAKKQGTYMMKAFTSKIGSQDDWNKNSISLPDVACIVWSSYVSSFDLDGLSLGWMLWIGQSGSSGTTLLTTTLWCLQTSSWVGIHRNIVNLEHLTRYMHLIVVGQLLWLKRYGGIHYQLSQIPMLSDDVYHRGRGLPDRNKL
jgi:hypothetical protein